MTADFKARRLRKEQTREKLIEAATEVFANSHYAVASIDDVIKAAGVSRATFYLHFENKAEVAKAIGDGLKPGVREIYANLFKLSSPTRSDVRAWLESYLGWYERAKVRLTVYFQAESLERSVSQDVWKEMDALLGRFETRRRSSNRDRARARGLLLISQLQRICYLWLARHWELPREETLQALTEDWHALLTER